MQLCVVYFTIVHMLVYNLLSLEIEIFLLLQNSQTEHFNRLVYKGFQMGNKCVVYSVCIIS